MAPSILDHSVLHEGHVSVKMYKDPNNPSLSREVNANGWNYDTNVFPGDRVLFKVWMKTSASTIGDPHSQSGIRCGIDFYANDNGLYITGTTDPYGNVKTNGIYPATNALNFVHWGTREWQLRTFDFIVHSQVPADGSQIAEGTMVTPVHLVAWIQIWCNECGNPISEMGEGWFADAELYINP